MQTFFSYIVYNKIWILEVIVVQNGYTLFTSSDYHLLKKFDKLHKSPTF